MLRWTRRRATAAARTRRATCSRSPPFLGARRCRWSARPSCRASAFTEAHLRGSRPVGWRAASAIAVEVGRQLRGRRALRVRLLRRHRQDRPRARVRRRTTRPSCAPPTASSATSSTRCRRAPSLLVTADHGQVEVGDRHHRSPTAELLAHGARCSRARGASAGCTPGRGAADELLPRRRPTRYGDVAWVVTREQIARRALVRADDGARRRGPARRRGARRPRRR